MEGYNDKYVEQSFKYLDYLAWQVNSNFTELKEVYDHGHPLAADDLYHDMATVEAHTCELARNLALFRHHMQIVLEGDEHNAKRNRYDQESMG